VDVSIRNPSFHRAAKFLDEQRKLYHRGRLDPKRQQEMEALGVVWSPYEDAWNRGLAELKRFVEQHGHANVTFQYRSFCPTAKFLERQRLYYREGRLDPKRQQALEALGVVWSPWEDAWNRGLTEFRRFVKRHGHANVPTKSASFHRAASFLHHTRRLYRQGRLDSKRQKEMESLGVVWSPLEEAWNKGLADLKRFVEQYGHANVTFQYPSFRRTALFLQTQRQYYREGWLDPKRQQALEDLGVVWKPQEIAIENAWNNGLAELKRFIERHGHARLPQRNPAFYRLAGFLQRSRRLYREGRLDPQKQQELNALGVL
jgi:hypothetical protein